MGILNSHESDPCCGKAIVKALLSGSLDTAEVWPCPVCGMEWKPTIVYGIRHWSPVPYVAIVGMR